MLQPAASSERASCGRIRIDVLGVFSHVLVWADGHPLRGQAMLVLLDMGADLHFRDAKGRTPLHTASTAGKVRPTLAYRLHAQPRAPPLRVAAAQPHRDNRIDRTARQQLGFAATGSGVDTVANAAWWRNERGIQYAVGNAVSD